MPAPTRRRFLLSAAAAAAAVRPARGVEPPARKVPFGFSLYGMKALAVPDALRVCAAVGYDAVEFALMPGYPTDPAKLTADEVTAIGKRTADAGLAVAGLMENLGEPADDDRHRANLDRLRRAFAFAHAVAPGRPPVVETVLGGKPAAWDMVKARLVDRLGAWAEAAAAAKVVVAVKPHVANSLHRPADARWLVKQVGSPWLKLAFDQSHFSLRGIPAADAAADMLPDTGFVHVKDGRGTADKFEFLLPGDGDTDFTTLFAVLKKGGYAGPVVVEVSGQVFNKPGYDSETAAKRCYAALAPALARSGLRG